MSPVYRTHHCNELRASDVGREVKLAGWVNMHRNLGGVVFLDLRDREGLTQVVFRPEDNAELAAEARKLGHEDVIQVTGEVAARIAGMANPNLPTGEIEVIAHELRVLNRAEDLPFEIGGDVKDEDLRLKYRYLDLRRPQLARNLRIRDKVVKAVRDYFHANGFIEVETPILSKSTPEGARDFLVPSRIWPGKFYALPQAPQQYKQLLMVAGVEKYFQIAKAFRDEDLRADRQPEFSQIDVEASFVRPDDILSLTEGMLAAIYRDALGVEIQTPFDRVTYYDAVNTYGSDKPDRRFGMKLVDLTGAFRQSGFKVFRGAIENGGVVKAINAKGFASVTTGQLADLETTAKKFGAKGLATIKAEGSEWKSAITKFLSDSERETLRTQLEIEQGDLILFAADKWDRACEVLGRLRLRVAEMLNLVPPNDVRDFLWVTDFPLLQFDPAEDKWNAVHHPFTRPHAADMQLLDEKKYAAVRAEAYDVVLDGVELGGGSIRIHEPELQAKIFSILGVNEQQQQELFGHMLRAFRTGAPPHGGIAFGLDRIVMLVCGETSIREVMAFPKTNRAQDLMSQSPSPADNRQLRDLGIKLAPERESS
ncbi:MAG: aspartate--tRNA ligase [Verrucomicrobia bacterium]|nr:aspartate--tRNA ligase [Verrucomicrobiota bacterium]